MNRGKFWVGLGISVAFLAIFFLTSEPQLLLGTLRQADYVFLFPAIGLYLISIFFRALRWNVLLKHIKFIKPIRLYPVVVVGYMANNLLPMRLGEVVRSYYLSEREGVSKVSALMSIFLERVLDALILILLIVFCIPFSPVFGLAEAFEQHHGGLYLLTGIALAFLFFIMFLLLFFAALSPARAQAIFLFVVKWVPSKFKPLIAQNIAKLIEGLMSLRKLDTMALLFLLSFPVWLCEAGLFVLIGYSFGLNDSYQNLIEMALAMILVTSVANIASSVPGPPGGIGIFEWIAREVLILIPATGIDRTLGTAYVSVVHAALLLPMILFGQLILWLDHISLVRLYRSSRSSMISSDLQADNDDEAHFIKSGDDQK